MSNYGVAGVVFSVVHLRGGIRPLAFGAAAWSLAIEAEGGVALLGVVNECFQAYGQGLIRTGNHSNLKKKACLKSQMRLKNRI